MMDSVSIGGKPVLFCAGGGYPGPGAGDPAQAESLFNYIVSKCREKVPAVRTGSFGAHMEVRLCNDGPFTIILDSDELFGKR